MTADGRPYRVPLNASLLLDHGEVRALRHAQPNPEPQSDEDDTEQERDPPGPTGTERSHSHCVALSSISRSLPIISVSCRRCGRSASRSR